MVRRRRSRRCEVANSFAEGGGRRGASGGGFFVRNCAWMNGEALRDLEGIRGIISQGGIEVFLRPVPFVHYSHLSKEGSWRGCFVRLHMTSAQL